MRYILRTLFALTLSILVFSCQKDDDPPATPPTANAGADQTIQLAASTFALSGSGTTQNGHITEYSWTLVSGPNTPSINNATSATTTVSGFVAGTYVFQLKVTNSYGLTVVDTITIIITGGVVPVANAGTDQTVQLPAAFFTLSGSGTTTSGTITGYQWSRISGPNTPVINNASSASTSVSGFIAGTYQFQLQVTNSFGLLAKDTVVINVIGTTTITLQPANNPNEFQVWNLNGTYGSGSGTADVPIIAWTSGGEPFTVREIEKFDLSSIPASATIISANLYMYSYPSPTINGNFQDANYGTNNAMLVQQVTSNWSPATLTWLNQPTTSTTNQIVVASTTQSTLDLNLDVTNMVGSMVNGNANYGFFFKIQNEVYYNSRIFVSSYNTTYPTKHPKLVIVYQ